MIVVKSKVKVDDAGFRKLRALNGARGPWRAALKQMAKRYEAFTRRRFARESAGGGDWPPLKSSTIARRRKGKGRGAPRILRDTGTLQKALAIGARGNHLKFKRFSVEYGFADAAHPGAEDITIRELAVVHDQGKGCVPARPILVEPDRETKRLMNGDVGRAERKMMAAASRAVRRIARF